MSFVYAHAREFSGVRAGFIPSFAISLYFFFFFCDNRSILKGLLIFCYHSEEVYKLYWRVGCAKQKILEY